MYEKKGWLNIENDNNWLMFVVLKTSEIKKIKILYKLFFPPAIIRNCFFSSNYKNFWVGWVIGSFKQTQRIDSF